MRVQIRVNPIAFQDQRNAKQRLYAESIEEKRWRARVHLAERRRAFERWQVSMERRLASMGADRQRGTASSGRRGPLTESDLGISCRISVGPFVVLSV